MKILIADDEELVRVGLREILRNLAQGDELYEAVNGRILIDKVNELKPDICFVDIRMPGVDGLEAIAELAGAFPDISWIILSGYSEFEYARRALALGVLEYLLKPASEAEVEAALIKAAEKRLDAGRFKREKFEYRVGGVLNNSSSPDFDEFLQSFRSYAALVFIPEVMDETVSVENQRRLVGKLRKWLDLNPPHGYAGVFIVLDGFPAIVAAGDDPVPLLKELDAQVPDDLRATGSAIFTPSLPGLPELMQYLETSGDINESVELSMQVEGSEKSARIVQRAENLVREKYTSPVGVAQIAEELNITPNYLSSLFKKYKQVSFTRYITDKRLDEALSLLKTPGITVKEAASGLGYMSSRHFTRLFREKYGITPSEYAGKNQ